MDIYVYMYVYICIYVYVCIYVDSAVATVLGTLMQYFSEP